MDKQLLSRVERLRGQMHAAYRIKQDLQHEEVLHLSQSLDELIMQVQLANQRDKRKK